MRVSEDNKIQIKKEKDENYKISVDCLNLSIEIEEGDESSLKDLIYELSGIL